MRRIAVVLGTAAVLVLAAAAPAWAHVTISPDSAPKGSDAVLTFNVPNEKEGVQTTQVQVKFPDDHPIADALVQPITGWTATVSTTPVKAPIKTDKGDVTEAVDTVTWKVAAGNKGIDAGQFQGFVVSVGLPDDAASLAFPTIQTYSDGSTVSWIQETPAGGPEPDNPKPELTLTAGDAGGATPSTAAPGTATAAKDTASKDDVDSAKTISIIALIVGAVGLLAGVGGFAMGRRKAT